MPWYTVTITRAHCGEQHGVCSQYQVPAGPVRAGSIAELYPAGELPKPLADLLTT